MSDEEAFFEVWFQLHRHNDWKKHYPNEAFREGWLMGYRDSMLAGWMARASLKVTRCRPSAHRNPAQNGTEHG